MMHDPMTVALEIKRPWAVPMSEDDRQRKADGRPVFRYRPAWVTIWHVDPERDGSDDSCGWSSPKLTKAQRSTLESLADSESRDLWFRKHRDKAIDSAVEAECLMRGALLLVARCLRVRITVDEATRWACELVHSPFDNVRASLAYLPGYHGNNIADADYYWRKDASLNLFCCAARYILRERRPWWRHPRWHIHHWKIQVHCLGDFKRWAFSRCQKCGKGFGWGESPTSSSWHGTGPLWFRSEKNVSHGNCAGIHVSGPVMSAQTPPPSEG